MVWPAIIAAGAALAGNLLGSEATSDEASAARDAQNAARAQDQAMAREFAQMGIQWRVQDAIAAGVHPLYALGGSGASYSGGGWSPVMADTGRFYSQAGQDVSRAALSMMSPEQKEIQQLQLERMRLENDKLFLDIYGDQAAAQPRMSAGSPPGVPGAMNAELGPALTTQHPDVRRAAIQMVEVDPPRVPISNPDMPYESIAESTPGLRRFVYPNRDGKPRPIWLPTNKEDPAEALESISESVALLHATIAVNSRLNGNFAYDFSYLLPGGEFVWGLRDIATELLAERKRQRDISRSVPQSQIRRTPGPREKY